MVKTCAPFRLRKSMTVVEGGFLTSPWCPEFETIAGHEALVLRAGDRNLAKALGRDMSSSMPFHGVDTFAHIAALRDAEVDRLLGLWLLKDDPLGQISGAAIVRGRMKTFAEADMPPFVEVQVSSFRLSCGREVAGSTLMVKSTARRGEPPCVVAGEAFLDWLALAVRTTWGARLKRPRVSGFGYDFEMPELPGGLKYKKRGDALALCCCYCGEDGAWKTHQETVTSHSIDSEEQLQLCLQPVIRSMQQFIAKHDHQLLVEQDDDGGVREPSG